VSYGESVTVESTELMITTPGFNKGADMILISENSAKHTSQRQNATKLGAIHLYQMMASKNLLFYILVMSAKFLTWLYVLAGSSGNPPTPGSCPYDSSLGDHNILILSCWASGN
jgi:hypothetical protein